MAAAPALMPLDWFVGGAALVATVALSFVAVQLVISASRFLRGKRRWVSGFEVKLNTGETPVPQKEKDDDHG